ncbi:MAG TPA: glycoside hydrolase family 15 protein [Candidatus Saccharimonadales bacterium]|nr:glycoside hydrolase family 15 protein [Candidatus Saccharimonadales bacterium]
MAREIVLSNGELFVGLNNYGEVHDFYFPYVGQENHAAAKELRHHIGVFVDGRLSWLDDGSWEIRCRYHQDSMIGHVTAHQRDLQVSLEFDDCVDVSQAAFLRNIHVINHANTHRNIRLFLHQAFVIGNSLDGDTAQYIPEEQAILHYKGHRAFVCAGRTSDGQPQGQFSIGLHGIEGHDGTFRDAEDGELSGNSVEHGRVDSILRFSLDIDKHNSKRILYWVAAGTSQREAFKIHQRILKNGLMHYQSRTADHWRNWLQPALNICQKLDKDHRQEFLTSLLVIKAHQDKRGSVIASGDTTMLNYARDAYAYCWPRDGAYALWPLLRLGYRDELIHFFNFIRRSLDSDKGYLMHKYQPDGSLGSSWHSYLHDDQVGAPIQEDETALIVFLFGRFIDKYDDKKLLVEFYPTMIKPMTDFMAGYIDEASNLPRPSYNLWEEIYQVNTYTTALTAAALGEAADLADQLDKAEDALRYRTVSDNIRAAVDKLWNADTNYFNRGLWLKDNQLKADPLIDVASFYGVYMFGLMEADDHRLKTAFETLKSRLLVDGVAAPRYENDAYNRQNDSGGGNPWPVTTLWLTQYAIETGDNEFTEAAINWVFDRLSYSGMLSEQYLSESMTPTSVGPLVWSHAELVSTLLDLVGKTETEV